MREITGQQTSLIVTAIAHEHARELAKMSTLLDEAPEVLGLVQTDLLAGVKNPKTGRSGMNAELVLRALIVKQLNGYSYDELAFHLADSATYQRFCRIGFVATVPSAKTLQRNIKRGPARDAGGPEPHPHAGGAATPHRARGQAARRLHRHRANIHEPTDSSLLDDCVRVLTRAMHRAKALVPFSFTDHTRRARRRTVAIMYAARKQARVPLYENLINVTTLTVRAAERAAAALDGYRGGDPLEAVNAMGLAIELRHYVPLAKQVISQTQRRVLGGESVPAAERVVSIFEPHTDIIRKDNRNTFYGHKLYLSSGPSGLVTDCVVLDGNPADSTLAVDAVDRHQDVFGRLPKQVAFDGGFASRANLDAIKGRGVTDVAFAKRRGLEITEMVKNSTVYRRLRNFRAGIEAGISFLKRAFGLGRCTWRGLASFKSYVWSSVVAANLLVMARHVPD